MSAKIDCPRCGKPINNTLEAYAEHIFDKHSDDLEMCKWARDELAKIGRRDNGNKPKFMGKGIDRTPPVRQKKLPKYLREQLGK